MNILDNPHKFFFVDKDKNQLPDFIKDDILIELIKDNKKIGSGEDSGLRYQPTH